MVPPLSRSLPLPHPQTRGSSHTRSPAFLPRPGSSPHARKLATFRYATRSLGLRTWLTSCTPGRTVSTDRACPGRVPRDHRRFRTTIRRIWGAAAGPPRHGGLCKLVARHGSKTKKPGCANGLTHPYAQAGLLIVWRGASALARSYRGPYSPSDRYSIVKPHYNAPTLLVKGERRSEPN